MLCAQNDGKWYRYYNQDSTKIGFKDQNGQVKIPPKFEPYPIDSVFDNVTVVTEIKSDSSYTSYYLNKNNKIFGRDSVYIYDFTFPKESQGKIHFREPKSYKAGFFDLDGNIVIPPIYDEVTPFHNGLSLVLYGARLQCIDEDVQDIKDCEHVVWKGGKQYMINAKNERIFEVPKQKDYSYTIDYSMLKVNENVDQDVYTSYIGKDGNTYSFYSPEKDFRKWLADVFLKDFKLHGTVEDKYFYDYVAVNKRIDDQRYTIWVNYRKEEIPQQDRQNIDKIINGVLKHSYEEIVDYEEYNDLEYDKEQNPIINLQDAITVSYLPRPQGDYGAENNFQFTKINGTFYITSIPTN